MNILNHEDVGLQGYDVFCIGIFMLRWGFGLRIAWYPADRYDREAHYGVRLVFWRKHYIWRLRKR